MKIVLRRHGRHRVGVGLLARARRHAEEAGLRVDRVEPAVAPNFIQAMSSPMVSTFQPGSVGISIARLVLPQADGNAPGDVLDLALGRGDLEDQHVLGDPALVARHRRRDPQREALLAEQGVAAVARAVRPDLARLGEVHDVLVVGVAGPRHVVGALLERGVPDLVRELARERARRYEWIDGGIARHPPSLEPGRGADTGGYEDEVGAETEDKTRGLPRSRAVRGENAAHVEEPITT